MSSKDIAPEVLDELRALLSRIDPEHRNDDGLAAAVRLAELIRREARDDRHVLDLVRIDEPELAPALERLCLRRK